MRDLHTHHLFRPPASRRAWEERARELRARILFSAGLWPAPPKTPLRPRVTGRTQGPDYTIENVAIETYPGFYLCGNLYRPRGKKGPFPAIVNPHGHWRNGRLEMQPDEPPAAPAPAPPGKGRANLVAIGVNLARQGFVVFAYDMVGYNDTVQIPGHRQFASGPEPWLWSISLLGLQLWNSLRAVDYLQSLPDVDRGRIGATGASGGATQAFLLAAVDQRIKAAVPVNMISAQMQGGCLCENAPGLRVGTDNVEIGALMAPRPLLLVAATGDWTKNNPREEWPAIKKVYDLYDAGDRTAVVQFNYGHNYNVESRQAMYAWFGRWLQNNADAFQEKPFTLDPQTLRVWDERTPPPAGAPGEPELIRQLRNLSEKQLAARWPGDEAGGKRLRQTMAPALRLALAVHPPAVAKGRRAAPRTDKKAALVVALAAEQGAQNSLRDALGEKGYEAVLLPLAPIEDSPDRLWDNFFTTYNRTPLGERVQEIVDALASVKARGDAPAAVVGVGPAGLWTLFARGLFPGAGRTVVDAAGFDNRDDAAYVRRLYAPGLRRAGDVRTAALLVAPAALCLYNTGTAFQTDAITAGCRALRAPLRIERGPLSPAQIAAWLSAR